MRGLQYGLVDPVKQGWATLQARGFRFSRDHYQRLLNVMVWFAGSATRTSEPAHCPWNGHKCCQIHHGTLLDIASTLRDVIVAEQVLAADRIDLAALQGRIKAESRSQSANAAYVLRAPSTGTGMREGLD